MAASHGHNHHHQHYARNERRLFWTALLTGTFMVVEAVGGYYANSLALLADAGHMLADFASLALAWFAFRLSRRPADRQRTYGFDRMQVLVAFGNGLALFAIAASIVVEAAHRLFEPVQVLGGVMLVIAGAGLLLNAGIFAVLHGADRENLNVRGAMVHVLGDLLGSVGAIVAAIVIMLTGWMPADAIISVIVALLILRSAWFVVRDSAHVLLEGTPAGMSIHDIEADLEQHVPSVEAIHHVHAWSITEERPLVTLHAVICEGGDAEAAVLAIKARLAEHFGVRHATVEAERAECADERLKLGRHSTADDDHDHDHDGARPHTHVH